MRSLRPIAGLAIDASAELFDTFLYAVFSLFVCNSGQFLSTSAHSAPMRRLYPSLYVAVNTILQRLQSHTFCNGKLQVATAENTSKWHSLVPTFLHPVGELKLDEEQSLCGLVPRFVAVESLKFIVHVVKWMDSIVPKYVSEKKRVRSLELATYADEIEKEFELAVYRSLAPRLVNSRPIVSNFSLQATS
jgi:hypothetical protein